MHADTGFPRRWMHFGDSLRMLLQKSLLHDLLQELPERGTAGPEVAVYQGKRVEAMGLEPTNLLTASQALYQLSYAPSGGGQI